MSIDFDKNVLKSLRKFAMDRFGSMNGLADAIGVRPQNLSAYLNGARKIGPKYWKRLKEIGFRLDIDDENCVILDENDVENCVIKDSEQLPDVGKTFEGLDINGAIDLANTPASRLATLVGVPAATLTAWQNGTEKPTTEQLANLFNLVVALGLSSRTTTSDKTEQPPAQATG